MSCHVDIVLHRRITIAQKNYFCVDLPCLGWIGRITGFAAGVFGRFIKDSREKKREKDSYVKPQLKSKIAEKEHLRSTI